MGTQTGESQVRSPAKTLVRYRPIGLVTSSTMIRKSSTCRTLLSVTGIGFPHFFAYKTYLKELRLEEGNQQVHEDGNCHNAHQQVFKRRIHRIPSLSYRRSQPSVNPINARNVTMVTTMTIRSSIQILLIGQWSF